MVEIVVGNNYLKFLVVGAHHRAQLCPYYHIKKCRGLVVGDSGDGGSMLMSLSLLVLLQDRVHTVSTCDIL